jgi:hypothetical protein
MPQKYIHYFGDEANQDLLAAYGIIPKDKSVDTTLRPKYCPNCNSPNQPEQHYCMGCGFVLTLTGYSKLMEQQQIKDKQIEEMMCKQEQFEQLIQSLKDLGQLTPNTK